MLLNRKLPRRGAVLIESALVYPIVFVIMLGIILLATAVFRYQQVAYMSREASRYASVHGAVCASDGYTAATPDDGLWSGGTGQCTLVYNNAIVPNSAGMHTENISYTVTWSTDNKQTHTTTKVDATTGETQVVSVANTVTVTVTYTWNTGFFGTIPVTSTSTVSMAY